jgi:hypothetical protein
VAAYDLLQLLEGFLDRVSGQTGLTIFWPSNVSSICSRKRQAVPPAFSNSERRYGERGSVALILRLRRVTSGDVA